MQNIFSYPIKLEDMSAAVKKYNLKAESKDLASITGLLKVPAVKSFVADINVKLRKKDHEADVWGNVKALITQTSVISLENFDQTYQTDFKLRFDTKMTLDEQIKLEEETEDVPDIFEDGKIDLAAIAMEQIALVLDDFPRKKGEVFNFVSEFDEETTKKSNPFAVLAQLKK